MTTKYASQSGDWVNWAKSSQIKCRPIRTSHDHVAIISQGAVYGCFKNLALINVCAAKLKFIQK